MAGWRPYRWFIEFGLGPEDIPNPVPGDFMKSLGYNHWHEACEIRAKRGERQGYCSVCDCWQWPEECGHAKSDKRKTIKR